MRLGYAISILVAFSNWNAYIDCGLSEVRRYSGVESQCLLYHAVKIVQLIQLGHWGLISKPGTLELLPQLFLNVLMF